MSGWRIWRGEGYWLRNQEPVDDGREYVGRNDDGEYSEPATFDCEVQAFHRNGVPAPDLAEYGYIIEVSDNNAVEHERAYS